MGARRRRLSEGALGQLEKVSSPSLAVFKKRLEGNLLGLLQRLPELSRGLG